MSKFKIYKTIFLSRPSSRWPFNEKTPLGFLVSTFFQFAENFSIFNIILSVLSFLLGSCWLFISIGEDIKNNLSGLKIRQKSERNSMQVKQQLCDIVETFSDAKELSIDIIFIQRPANL